ncbi:hypothetical protein [Henriciella sp.]|uniref:hypothetical protein n=1 Tax=Henriciella sp. TaxID=1968823 RepID=UPI00262DD9D9|nr:hypothetical protein [Henriciella sp.]
MKRFIIPAVALAMAPAAYAADISVGYSPEFQEALQNDYGMREGERLSEEIREDLERELRKANIDPARIDVTILDAKPNRPTMQQAADRPGLDMIRSVSIGGMDLKGVAFDAQGNAIAELEYDWFETNIRDVYASGTWGDAKRTSSRFARKFTEKLSGQ